MAEVVLDLLGQTDRRSELGAWPSERVRRCFGIEPFRESMAQVVAEALGQPGLAETGKPR
jgi:hypothetical protein